MGRILKCECVACARFRTDRTEFLATTRGMARFLPPDVLEIARRLIEEKGCDLCGQDAHRVVYVPQIVKDFLRVEHLCEWCRNRFEWARQSLKWPICWGSTPDEELKWFMLYDVLARMNEEIRKHTPLGLQREREWQEFLASLPPPEPVPDLEITIRRRPEATT